MGCEAVLMLIQAGLTKSIRDKVNFSKTKKKQSKRGLGLLEVSIRGESFQAELDS